MVTLAVSAFLTAGVAFAQTNPDGAEAPPRTGESGDANSESDFSFGSQTQDLVVQASQCHSRTATPHLVHATFQFFGNETAAAGSANCPVTLPHGARVTAIECIVRDASAAGDVSVALVRSPFDVVANTTVGSTTLATVTSTGATGYQTLTATLTTPETVRRRSGNNRNVYWLFLQLPADTAANASLRDCTILWNRQVSTPPGTATFTDVPVGHPQRPFVEALVAAGITGGCGGGAYCPNDSLTRGQMAVFLAVALGLHFPN
ncbi:MAG TPA: S-layer homology domain-containing protein [Vicinamibacteria bacterium]|nr:S-layer homology domain-containing protein [Vicinamibacteria bacterium]